MGLRKKMSSLFNSVAVITGKKPFTNNRDTRAQTMGIFSFMDIEGDIFANTLEVGFTYVLGYTVYCI